MLLAFLKIATKGVCVLEAEPKMFSFWKLLPLF